jgi:hypothetical protein
MKADPAISCMEEGLSFLGLLSFFPQAKKPEGQIGSLNYLLRSLRDKAWHGLLSKELLVSISPMAAFIDSTFKSPDHINKPCILHCNMLFLMSCPIQNPIKHSNSQIHNCRPKSNSPNHWPLPFFRQPSKPKVHGNCTKVSSHSNETADNSDI